MAAKLMQLIEKRWGADAQSAIIARHLTPLAPDSAESVSTGDAVAVSAKEPNRLFSVASCLEVAVKAGHLRDFCGPIAPLIPKRWLQWSLPFLLQLVEKEGMHALLSAASSALEMGYNALFIGEGFGYEAEAVPMSASRFLAIASRAFEAARAMNMQVGIDITRFEVADRKILQQFFSDHPVASVFHARLEETFGQREGLLRDEKLLLGLQSVRELCAEHTLIVAHLIDEHFGDSKTLTALIARLPRNCQLSFCALGESPDQIFGPPHSIWKTLRGRSMRGPIPLIPIFNPGQTGWGGGLWPTLPPLEWDGLLQRAVREGFESVLALTPHLPRGEGFLRASLWIFGQAQWRALPMEDLWQTWRAGHRSDWNLSQKAQQSLLQLSKSLQRLTFRKTGICDLFDIKALRSNIALLRLRLPDIVSGELLLEAANLFLTDARHLLIAALQEGVGAHQGTQYHALLQALLQEEGSEVGIWTELRGSGAGAKMGWRSTPLATSYRGADVIAREGGYPSPTL